MDIKYTKSGLTVLSEPGLSMASLANSLGGKQQMKCKYLCFFRRIATPMLFQKYLSNNFLLKEDKTC